jgi:hypothetical protein
LGIPEISIDEFGYNLNYGTAKPKRLRKKFPAFAEAFFGLEGFRVSL